MHFEVSRTPAGQHLVGGEAIELVKKSRALLEVDRTPVVRIDERQIPELGSLVYIRDTRGRDLDQNLSAGVHGAGQHDGSARCREVLMEGGGPGWIQSS